jgi:glucose/arabinose dehydrogenase
MWKHIRNLSVIAILLIIAAVYWLTRPDVAQLPMDKVTGPNPEILNQAREQTIPTVNIAEVNRWKDGAKPVAAPGLKVELFAADLDHPRNMFVLPNGDILVAETNKPARKGGGGFAGWIEDSLMEKAGAGVVSANRITLLRDSNGDGKVDLKSVFMEGLQSPFGMALIGDRLYIGNTGGVVAVPYKNGDTKITEKPVNIYNLNSNAPNMHWTKNLIASKDGKKLYIAAGSNSNIAESGLENEKGRAMIIEFDMATRKGKPYSVGLRNPVGMDFDSRGRLWTVVNERDMLGSDAVPDYLAMAEFASDYGWPWHYWGGFTDKRVQPMREDKRSYERRPEYALGPHVAALGLAFADKAKLGNAFASGAFVTRHGSWNRVPASGYDVVFVKFDEKGRPVGMPAPVLTNFLDKDGKAQGRPTMLTVAKDGSLLVSDDVGNRVWRVTAG